MEDYQNILCATDFSDNSRIAAERAVDMARRYAAKLTLLHVVEHFPQDRSNVVIAPENVDPELYREDNARKLLAEFARHLELDEVVQTVRLSSCSAQREIIQFAEEQHTDLIVVASHACKGLNRILGSTAYGVVHSGVCDVLAVHVKAK